MTAAPLASSRSLAFLAAVLALLLIDSPVHGQDTSSVQTLKDLNLEALGDVEVTSVSRVPERLLDAASAIQVVTSQDITASTATSLPEALRLASNLNVAQENSHDWAISARGFDANLADKLLVLIDGRAVYTPLYGGVLWNVQDAMLEDIDRIEVISGPGGVQWGANAMNGVINVSTKPAQDTQGLYVEEAGAGGELRDLSGVRYGGTLTPGVFYRVYGQYADHGEEPLADGSPNTDSWEMARGGFRVDAPGTGGSSWTVQGDLYQGSAFMGALGDERLGGANLLGHWSGTLDNGSKLSLVAYADRTHLSLPYAASPGTPPYYSGFPESALVDDLNTYNVDFQDSMGSERTNALVWGMSFQHTDEDDTNLNILQFRPEKLSQNLYTGFVEDRVALSPQLHLSAGTKLEHNDYTGFEFEPSLRLAWDVTPDQLIWGAVSRAVRTPSRFDRDLRIPTGLQNAPAPYVFPTDYLDGLSTFRSETLIAYELGYRAQFTPQLSASLSAYYNSYDHLRSEAATPTTPTYPFGFPLVFGNALEAETAGIEASGDWQVTPAWRLHAGYDLMHENIHAVPGYIDATGATYETADPKAQLFLRSNLNLRPSVSLFAGVRWIDQFTTGDGPTSGAVTAIVPSYWELDLRLSWRVNTHLELSVAGQNLLHNRHPEYGYPGPTTADIARTGYAKAEWRY